MSNELPEPPSPWIDPDAWRAAIASDAPRLLAIDWPSLARGLAQSAAGELHSRGSFAEFATDDE